jgi:hypothetical protein
MLWQSQYIDFGQRQLQELVREELQIILSRKLSNGLSWKTVHHFKCGLSKILGAAEGWGYVAENVAQKTRLPRRQHGTERKVLTYRKRLGSRSPLYPNTLPQAFPIKASDDTPGKRRERHFYMRRVVQLIGEPRGPNHEVYGS